MIYLVPWSELRALKERLLEHYDAEKYESPDWSQIHDPYQFYPFDSEFSALVDKIQLTTLTGKSFCFTDDNDLLQRVFYVYDVLRHLLPDEEARRFDQFWEPLTGVSGSGVTRNDLFKKGELHSMVGLIFSPDRAARLVEIFDSLRIEKLLALARKSNPAGDGWPHTEAKRIFADFEMSPDERPESLRLDLLEAEWLIGLTHAQEKGMGLVCYYSDVA